MADWIILVDSDTKKREQLGQILHEHDMRVTEIESGVQLLQQIRENGIPDMILMNADMSDMDGFETLSRLSEVHPGDKEILTILYDYSQDQERETKGFELGALDYIRMPVNPEVLVSRVRRVLDFQRKIQKFEREAKIDQMTGFLNKQETESRMAELCQTENGFLCIMDLDAFKSINDVFGHDMGDNVLVMFSQLLEKNLRIGGECGRIGGDEFIVFVRGMETEEELAQFTRSINEGYIQGAEEIMGAHLAIPVGVSIGAASVPGDGQEYSKLFKLADQALYYVKQNGKHGYALYRNIGQERREMRDEMDLATVTSILEERNASQNAMWMGKEMFGSIYRYMVRFMGRYHSMAYRVLITVKSDESKTDEERDEIMAMFRKMLQHSLRNSDVMMECGENQFFLLLPEIQEYDIDRVVNRLLSTWRNSEYAEGTQVSYETGKVLTKRTREVELGSEPDEWVVAVDDEDVHLRMISRVLTRQNMSVTTLSSGQALLDLARVHKPNLILIDASMPEMDGFETLRRLRMETPNFDTPVIFLTSEDTHDFEHRCIEMGAMDFIRKPFIAETLLLRVRHTIELVQLQRNLASAVERKTSEYEKLTLSVVRALTEAIDAKDEYTYGHSGRVAEYAREISKRYGYSKRQQDEIYLMSLLHDVGEIGISDGILNKPGKLTAEEYEIIKMHPVVGAKILQNIDGMPRLEIGARWHHERYDGKGYPEGLSGGQIPEQARIIAVADAYDAMTSHRSYRSAMPQDYVRSEIEKGSGTQFDPQFAKIMLAMIDEDLDFMMRE